MTERDAVAANGPGAAYPEVHRLGQG
jgi:hypothetical protein